MKARGFLEAILQVDGTEKRFGGIGQDGFAPEPARAQLATAQPQHRPDADGRTDAGQWPGADELRAQSAQCALAGGRKAVEQFLGHHHAQHGVAEEFQPLVVVVVEAAVA